MLEQTKFIETTKFEETSEITVTYTLQWFSRIHCRLNFAIKIKYKQ